MRLRISAQWRSGNNQAPEPGVRRCDPPVLEMPCQHGHNGNERHETECRKMAAPPALPSCGLYLPEEKAANSWVGGSRSISVSKQRAPGLAAVRICRCNSVGTIGTDSAHSLCPHSVMVFGTASVSSDAEREEPRDIRQVRLIARLAKVRPGRVAAKVFPFHRGIIAPASRSVIAAATRSKLA